MRTVVPPSRWHDLVGSTPGIGVEQGFLGTDSEQSAIIR